MKFFNTIILFLLFCTSIKAQKFFATTFDKLPQDYQLYPRNEQSEALVPIYGKIEVTGWDYFSVQVFRNKQQIGYQKAPINYTNAVGKFSFSPIKIKAENAEYDFKIYAVKGKDSLNVVNRGNIVSGDVYILSGQSNATDFFNDSRTNEFCRTYGKISGTWGTENGNPADTLWALSNQDKYYQGVGTMGFEFQKNILEKYGIPTCLINGGFNWSSMKQHATRTADNPADLTNGYGRMIYRIQKAGVTQAVKALIYRQGETEAYGEGADWGGNFDIYYKNLKTDLPSIKQIYLFQIDVIGFTTLPQAPQVRNIQRMESDKYPDIQVVASVGTEGFDGLHYTPAGWNQNALEFSRLIGRDFYNDSDTDNINAPNIRKAYFSAKDKSEITIVFDKGQELTWTDQNKNMVMKNQYYLDGQNQVVASGYAIGNKVVIKLIQPTTATQLSYLPPFIPNSSPDYPYTGPYIKNKRGLRALSFHEVKIEPFDPNIVIITPKALDSPNLTASATYIDAVQLNWNAIPNAINYIIERKNLITNSFEQIANVDSNVLVYQDKLLKNNTLYTYRIKAVGTFTESPYANIDVKTNTALQSPQLTLTVVYYNSLKINWNAVANATSYILQRKDPNQDYKNLGTFDQTILLFTDKNLSPNTLYSYRIKALGAKTESVFVSIDGTTPAMLTTPGMTVIPVSFNTLNISWKPVQNVVKYVLERKLLETDDYKELVRLDSTKIEYVDISLKDKTSYFYRLKAYGNKTESNFATAKGITPAMLTTPEMMVVPISYNTLKVSWKPAQNVVQYVLERKLLETDDYKELLRLDSTKIEYVDISLKDKTSYFYRLKAYGNKTESNFATAKGTTPVILQNEQEIFAVFELFPNPAQTQITLRFSKPMSGQINMVDLRGVEIFKKDILKNTELIIQLDDYYLGTYILSFKNEDGIFTKKLVIE